jgi:hypothetical protein
MSRHAPHPFCSVTAGACVPSSSRDWYRINAGTPELIFFSKESVSVWAPRTKLRAHAATDKITHPGLIASKRRF